MEHHCSKTPDPPDGDLEGKVTPDEDSQKSITLQNALEPLPDTQSTGQGTQQISPERRAVFAAPFISQPAQPDVDDLAFSFSYEKPSAVKPGQFSGRHPARPLNPIIGHCNDGSGLDLPSEPQNKQSITSRGFVTGRTNPAMHSHRLPLKDTGLSQGSTVKSAQFPIHSDQTSCLVQQDLCFQAIEAEPTSAAPSRGETQNNTRHGIVVDEVIGISVPEKKRPFSDYQPTYRAAGSQGQTLLSTASSETHSDQVLNPFPDHQLAQSNGAGAQKNQQHQPSQTTPVNIPQPKSRTSFQNDISVSSARPPRSMPGCSPRFTVANRPLKDSHRRTTRSSTPATRPRSSGSIVKSNSKAKRASRPTQVSSTSRSSSRWGSHDEETPSVKQRSKWTPAGMLQDQFHQKLATTAADIAGCFNDKFADIGAEVDQHLQTIADLKECMSKQRQDLTHFKERITEKDDKIQELEGKCDRLSAKIDTTHQELDARSAKVSKLEEKCRSYKEFLNSAIAEQQELYKATKVKCDGALAQMKSEERKRNALQDHDRKQAEVARERLNQLVQSTVTECKQKERDFNKQIEGLNRKVQEREADIVRERATAQALLEQDCSINKMRDTLRIFGKQIEEVASKVNAVITQQHDTDGQSAKDMDVKLDKIVDYLRNLDEQKLPMAELSKEMRELSEKTVMSISEKLEPVIVAQLSTRTSLDELCHFIEACMNDIWDDLDERQTAIEDDYILYEEAYLRQEHEHEQRVRLLHEEVRVLENDLAKQNQLVLRSQQELQQRQASIDKLHSDIENLAQDKEKHLDDSEQLERLRNEFEDLKNESTTKASMVAELQTELQHAVVQLATEKQKHNEDNDNFQRLMEQQVTKAGAAHIQAVKVAQQDIMLKMNEAKANINEQLTQALDQRSALQHQLDEAKQKMSLIEAESSRATEKATNLEKELHASQAEVAKGIVEASLKNAKQQAAKEQQMKLIQELQTKLSTVEGSFAKLRRTTQSYDEAVQSILSGMKEWTASNANIRSMFRDLQQKKDQNEVLKGIDRKFKPLVELQLLQTAVSQYCQAQKGTAHLLSEDPDSDKTVTSALPVTESLNMAAGRVLDRMRRVTVLSPASNASSPQAPSVQIEQKRRRLVEPTRSILKLVTQNQPDSVGDVLLEEDAHEELRSNTSMNRGPYNRLVAGSKSRAVLPVPRPSQRTPSSRSGNKCVSDRFQTAPGAKRKQNLEDGSDDEDSRSMKRKTSTISMFALSSPAENANGKARPKSVSRALDKASLREAVDLEQSKSSGASQSSQEQSQSQSAILNTRIKFRDLDITGIRSSQRSSNDPSLLFTAHPHPTRSIRTNEESQESLVHSQDLVNDGTFSISSRYSFAP